MIRKIFFFLTALFLMNIGFGAICNDISFNTSSTIYDNSSFIMTLESLDGTPLNPWLNYSNVTLSYNVSVFDNLDNDFIDLENSAVIVENFEFLANTSGNFTLSAQLFNSTINCFVNTTIEVFPSVLDPNLNVSSSGLGAILNISETYNFNLILNNSGLGIAYNISGNLASVGNISFGTSIINENIINNNSVLSIANNMTPNFCGATTIDVQILDYFNAKGIFIDSFIEEVSSFNIIGSDIDVLENSFSYIDNNDGSFNLNISIKNIGNLNASNVYVSFYNGDYNNLIQRVFIGNISINESIEVISQGTGFLSGTYSILTKVEATNECPSGNQETIPTNMILDVTSDDDNGGGSSGSGSSSSTTYINVDFKNYNLKQGTYFRFNIDNINYVFRVDSVSTLRNEVTFIDSSNNNFIIKLNESYVFNFTNTTGVKILVEDIASREVSFKLIELQYLNDGNETIVIEVKDENNDNKEELDDIGDGNFDVTIGNKTHDLFNFNLSETISINNSANNQTGLFNEGLSTMSWSIIGVVLVFAIMLIIFILI